MGSKVGLGNRFACVWSRARYKGRCALTVGPVCRVGSAAAAPCGRAGVLNARKSVAVGVTTEPGAAIGASRTSRSGVPPRRGCQLTGRGAAERPDGILARVRSVTGHPTAPFSRGGPQTTALESMTIRQRNRVDFTLPYDPRGATLPHVAPPTEPQRAGAHRRHSAHR